MKKRLFNSNFLLILVVLAFFAGGFCFVIYEPAEEPVKPVSEVPQTDSAPEPVRNSVSPPRSKAEPSQKLKKPQTGKSKSKTSSETKSQPVQPQETTAAPPGSADFGIEGVIYALSSGLPLPGCEINFSGQSAISDVNGEFHLWLDGGLGALSFSYAGAKKLQISNFDISAGNGIAHFDVYIDETGKAGSGRIEINGVSGRVYSRASGAPLAGARISLNNRRGVADRAGFFELWGNDTALLTMTVSASGYVSEMISGIDFENQTNPFFYEVSLQRELSGKGRRHIALVGIGARLVQSEEGYEVADLIAGSPADNAGLSPGDRLVVVDSLAVDDFNLREVVELIRGQENLPVTLMVERDGDFLEFTCVRKRVVY